MTVVAFGFSDEFCRTDESGPRMPAAHCSRQIRELEPVSQPSRCVSSGWRQECAAAPVAAELASSASQLLRFTGNQAASSGRSTSVRSLPNTQIVCCRDDQRIPVRGPA
jgi:hypothetical protein